MKILGFGSNAIRVELDPTDCFVIADACRLTVENDGGTDQPAIEAMEHIMTLAAMAAANWDSFTGNQNHSMKKVRKAWLPPRAF